jgi:hypothetical protein
MIGPHEIGKVGYFSMSLNANVIDSAVRITSTGDLLGTGFIVSVPSETRPAGTWDYLVTADHVVKNQAEIAVEIPQPFGNGLYEPVSVPEDNWLQPLPDADLAIAQFPRRKDEPRRSFPIGNLLPLELIDSPTLGTTIYYVGIFEPLRRPIARSGTLAALDQGSIPHRQGYSYIAHLVDCRSYDGFSGSPCFAEFAYPTLDEIPTEFLPWGSIQIEDPPRIGNMAYYTVLCGLFTGHFSDEDCQRGIPPSRYGVGTMLRSHEIKEALMADERREERKRLDVEHEEAWQARQPPLEDVGAKSDEFDRFEDLTGKLLKVPKKELDEKREEERKGGQ